MKILITNIFLAHYTGTESWMYAMCNELRKNHEVIVWTTSLGTMSKKIEELGIKVYTEQPTEHYDFAIVNHNIFWDKVKDPKIFTSHSKFYAVEQPPKGIKYAGVNEYIGGDWIIRNGVDLERFKPTPINKECKNILLLSNPVYARGKEFVRKALSNYNVITLDEEVFEIENEIAKADLVISFQRGAIESLACGKNVIYADWRDHTAVFEGYDIINKDTYDLFKTGAMRRDIKYISPDELREMVKKYDPDCNLRPEIERDFNIKTTAQQYIDLCTQL